MADRTSDIRMPTTKPAEATNNLDNKDCGFCKIGKLKSDVEQFSVDRGDKIILVGNVPAFVCGTCGHKEFDEALADQLRLRAHQLFEKSNCVMFAYQFDDLIREEGSVQTFETFDQVRIKDDVDTWDMYDEDLLPGMTGKVLGPGVSPFHYQVQFRLGSGKRDSLVVDIDERDLESVQCGAVESKGKRRGKIGRRSESGQGSH